MFSRYDFVYISRLHFTYNYTRSQRDSSLGKLSDTWDRIATIFSTDNRVVIGKVDCDDEVTD